MSDQEEFEVEAIGVEVNMQPIELYKVLKSLNFDLPKGQAAHVLRHTFASHFIMNGGNVLTLQKILGHASVLQTMTYAHLAPDYLTEALEFNPLATL